MLTRKRFWRVTLALCLGLLFGPIFQSTAAAQQGRQLPLKRRPIIRPMTPVHRYQDAEDKAADKDLIALASGVAQTGSGPAPIEMGTGVFYRLQYAIQVPADAKRMRIELEGDQDVDLYVRFGERITIGNDGRPNADHMSETLSNDEAIVLLPSSDPALRAGTYYIGVANFGPGEVKFTIKASVGDAAPRSVVSVSAASFRTDVLAAEQIVAAFGEGLATRVEAGTPIRGMLPTELSGTRVRVRDSADVEVNAGLFFVAPSQINYLTPRDMAPGEALVTVTSGDGAVSTGSVMIAPTAPGLFTANSDGHGLAAALVLRVRADGKQSYEPVARYDTETRQFVAVSIDPGPASDQLFLILFGTGFRGRSSLSSVSVAVGGLPADVLYAGPQGNGGAWDTLIGLDQLNVRLPRSLAGRGDLDIVMTADGRASNPVKINLR